MSSYNPRRGRSYAKRAKVGEVFDANSRGRVDYEIESGGGSLLSAFDEQGKFKPEITLVSLLKAKVVDRDNAKGRHAY